MPTDRIAWTPYGEKYKPHSGGFGTTYLGPYKGSTPKPQPKPSPRPSGGGGSGGGGTGGSGGSTPAPAPAPRDPRSHSIRSDGRKPSIQHRADDTGPDRHQRNAGKDEQRAQERAQRTQDIQNFNDAVLGGDPFVGFGTPGPRPAPSQPPSSSPRPTPTPDIKGRKFVEDVLSGDPFAGLPGGGFVGPDPSSDISPPKPPRLGVLTDKGTITTKGLSSGISDMMSGLGASISAQVPGTQFKTHTAFRPTDRKAATGGAPLFAVDKRYATAIGGAPLFTKDVAGRVVRASQRLGEPIHFGHVGDTGARTSGGVPGGAHYQGIAGDLNIPYYSARMRPSQGPGDPGDKSFQRLRGALESEGMKMLGYGRGPGGGRMWEWWHYSPTGK